MPNPFYNRFDNTCNSCGEPTYEGDAIYAHEGTFICHSCADSNGNICPGKCGENYKKTGFDMCFSCNAELEDKGVPF